MSRHRNIRSMNYTDEYDGYDDVYGHSVEEDCCMSPSDAAFMYDREGPRNQPRIGAFLSTENDIAEEEEGESNVQEIISSLSPADRAKLETCLNDMRITLGPDVTKERMMQVAQSHKFNSEKSINYLLDLQSQQPSKSPTKIDKESTIVSVKKFTIPKLNLGGRPTKKPSASNLNSTNSTCSLVSTSTNNSGTYINSCNEVKILQNICNNISDLSISNADIQSANIASKEIESLSICQADSAWNIDFTAAIKKEKVAPPLKRVADTNVNSNFTPGFIDCDPLVKLTASFFVDTTTLNSEKSYNFKRLSLFGKALCTKYQRKVPCLLHSNDPRKLNRLEKFQFDTISPDDRISGHLRRK